MVLKLQRKSRTRTPPGKPNGKRPAKLAPADRYQRLVETAADDGIETVDEDELAKVLVLTKKPLDDFHADVTRLENRRHAVEQLREADEMQSEIDRLMKHIEQDTKTLDKLRAEFYEKELPLVQSIASDRDARQAMLIDQRDLRTNGTRQLRESADPAIEQSIEQLRRERTKVCAELEGLPREMAKAEQHQRSVEKLQRQFDDWRKGRPVGLPADNTGLVRLPLWHPDAGAWGQLEKPTPTALREGQARLQKFIDSQNTPDQIRQHIASCKRRIAEYDVQIDELHAAMLR